jgi:putative acetyltransferase
MQIRPIQAIDNEQVAHIIRTVMTEYGAVGEGYSIMDPEVDTMFEAYTKPGLAYFVLADAHGALEGCGGFGPLAGAASDMCELKKMYFLPTARGKGFGRAMLALCMREALVQNYQFMYLETLANITEAGRLYRAAGFEPTPHGQMGATGHTACNSFYIKTLAAK